MPRVARVDVGEEIYHVINRGNGRLGIFASNEDYALFETLLEETKELLGMRILAYVLMPNHWHLVLYPKRDGDLATFVHRVSNAHTRKVHARTGTNGSGHLYQGRYKSFLVGCGNHLLALIKYVERNPVRANLVHKSEDWRWSSAWRRINGTRQQQKLLDSSPEPFPYGYKLWINTPDSDENLAVIRASVVKGMPYGRELWVEKMIKTYHLESTLRPPGRPRKN